MYDLSDKKRVVVKVGTSNIAHKTGNLNLRRVEKLVRVLSDLKNSGREIIFVSSGAIGVGSGKLGLSKRPEDTAMKQACAAVGQCLLMNTYESEFSRYNHSVAQILITRDVFSNKERLQNVKNTFSQLLEMNVLPIINANDSVSIEQLDFDENDTLSALVATVTEADLLILLTDVDGLYDKNPSEPDANFIHEVDKITTEMINSTKEKGSAFSSGGMLTKLEAAQIAKDSGIPTVILNGDDSNKLYGVFEGTAKFTVFVP